MIYLVRIRKPAGPLRVVALRPAHRPPHRLIRLHTFARRPALPAAPPHESPGPPAVEHVEPPDAATAQDTREEPRRDESPADTRGEQRGAAGGRDDERGAAADKRDELREKALAASSDDYKELTGTWRYLDTKAQVNIAIAGVFIAAAFTYLTRLTPAGLAEVLLLFLTVLSLVVCVFISVLALRVQDAPSPVLGDFLRRQVADLEGKSDEEFRASLPSFYKERADLWNRPTEQLSATLRRQGSLLWGAQVFLVVAILSAAILVIFKLFTSG